MADLKEVSRKRALQKKTVALCAVQQTPISVVAIDLVEIVRGENLRLKHTGSIVFANTMSCFCHNKTWSV